MEYVELPAPPPLDELVRCFWFLRGTFPDSDTQTIVADGRLEIILHLAEPFSLVGDNGRGSRQADALVSGQLDPRPKCPRCVSHESRRVGRRASNDNSLTASSSYCPVVVNPKIKTF